MAKLPEALNLVTTEQIGIWTEFRNQTNRGAAVLGGALVEDALSVALMRDWRNDDSQYCRTMRKQFLREGGPMTFGIKIELAYLLWLIGPTVHADLVNVKDVRNKFAHWVSRPDDETLTSEVSFDTPKIQTYCNNFTMIEKVPVILDGEHLPIKTSKERFIATVFLMYMAFEIYTHNPTGSWPPDDKFLSH